MPPIVIPIGLAAAIGVSAGTAGTIIGLVLTAAMALTSLLFSPKPKPFRASDIDEVREDGYTLESNDPVLKRRWVYGSRRVGGHRVYMGATGNNQYLHWVAYLCDGPVAGIPVVFFDDYPIYIGIDTDSDGVVTGGRYANKARVRVYTGETDQAADSDLVADITDWTTDHRLRGMAYMYIRLEYDRDTFGNGRPAFSALVNGQKVTDPRVTGDDYLSQNTAVVLRDFFLRSRLDGGIGALSTEIDDSNISTEADVCDEQVAVQQVDSTVNFVDDTAQSPTGGSWVDFNIDALEFQRGDTVRISSTGSVPGGLSAGTDYFVIPVTHWKRDVDSAVIYPRMRFGATLHDAMIGNFIELTSAGSGTITVSKTKEPRYTCNFVCDHSRRPGDMIKDIMSSAQARQAYIGGVFRFKMAQWEAPTVTFTEDDIISPIVTPTRISRRERFNRLQGTYADPRVRWVLESYPVVKSTAYETADNGEILLGSLPLPATSRATTAQRLAAIALKRHRNQIRTTFTTHLVGLQIDALRTFNFQNTVRGWTGGSVQAFETEKLTLDGNPQTGVLSVRIQGWNVVSADFDWDESAEEVAPRTFPTTNLPDPWTVAAPTSLTVTSGDAVSDRRLDGTMFTRAKLTWTAPADTFVTSGGQVQVRYKKTADSDWIYEPPIPGAITTTYVLDLQDGAAYDFEIRSINVVGTVSDLDSATNWSASSTNQTVSGKTNPPSNVSGVYLSVMTDGTLIAEINPTVTDADLLGYEFRYMASPFDWSKANKFFEELSASAMQSLAVPPGTWVVGVKAVDRTGNKSTTEATATITVPNVNFVLETNTYAPTFAGGTLYRLLRHTTAGALVPDSSEADASTLWDTVDGPSPNTYTDGYWEAPEIDLGVDSDYTRIFGSISTGVLPDQTGVTDGPTSQLQIDYKTAAGAYDGFEPWLNGTVSARYVKARCYLGYDDGHGFIDAFNLTVDAEKVIQDGDVTISIGGTAVTFDTPFPVPPKVVTENTDSTARIVHATSITTTGFTVYSYDENLNDVGGSAYWQARLGG